MMWSRQSGASWAPGRQAIQERWTPLPRDCWSCWSGRATRLARFVEGQLKTYLATARLGVQTDTDDLTGRIDRELRHPAAWIQLGSRMHWPSLWVRSLQRPPDFSAKHVGGERSYHKARRGETVQLEPVSVTVAAPGDAGVDATAGHLPGGGRARAPISGQLPGIWASGWESGRT